MEKERVGFVGLGNMGSRMAGRIREAGYPLAVYDVSNEKTRVFYEQGVTVAGSRGISQQVSAAEMAKGIDEDYAAVIRLMQETAGIGEAR